MRKSIIAMCFMLIFSVSAFAASPKIGVVNMQRIIAKSEPGQNAMNKLQEKFKGVKEKMNKQKEDIQALRRDIQKQSLVLTQEAKADKEMEFKHKVRDFQDMYRGYQRKIKQEEQKLSEPVLKLIAKTISDYGKKQGYTTITDAQASGLIYADKKADLTDTIIVEVNRAWRAQQGKK